MTPALAKLGLLRNAGTALDHRDIESGATQSMGSADADDAGPYHDGAH